MSLLVKIHKKDGRTVIAVCDKDLIGKVFKEKNLQLDLSGEFYNGEERSPEEIGDLIRNAADSVNLVGKESVDLGINEGIIDKEQVLVVQNIPHAQAVLMQNN